LTICNIDPGVKEWLRVDAAIKDRSMEAELRATALEAVDRDRVREPNLAEAIRRRLAPLGGVELEPHPPVPIGEPSRFDP
jgi:antitoxin FitA